MPSIHRSSKRFTFYFTIALFLLALMVQFAVCPAFAQSPSVSTEKPVASRPDDVTKNDTGKIVSFRRWLAPSGRINDWPYEPGQYMPFDRQLFEQWISQLAPPQNNNTNDKKLSVESPFAQMTLSAEWENGQLVRGTGFVRLQPLTNEQSLEKTSQTRCCSFAPPGFWMDSATLDDGTPIPLTGSADGKLKFIVPPESIKKDQTVHFHWSQRGRVYSPQSTAFDFTLPPCPATELLLTLPQTLTPMLSGGIVQEEPQTEQEIQEENKDGKKNQKRWRILFGRQALSTLVITSQKIAVTQYRTGTRQTLVYNIAPQGTDIRSTFVFDKTDASISNLEIDLDPTLRLIEVLYGDQRIPWTPHSSGNSLEGSRIIVNLSNVSQNEQQELTLRAISPVNEPLIRQLPRIRIVSDNVFWQETRCHLVIQNPYKIQAVEAPQAVRVSTGSSAEQTDREVLTFQFFEDDAVVSIILADSQPKVTWNSATQVLLENNDIQGTVTIDAAVEDGNSYVLTLPLSPEWTIDSVKSIYRLSDSVKTADANEIIFWDIVKPSDAQPIKNNVLTLQLKQPLLPKQIFRFRITGRRPINGEQQHQLAEVTPLADEGQKYGIHLLAIQSILPFHLQYSLLPESTDSLVRQFQNFNETPQGTVLLLDAHTREIPFEITRQQSNYSVEIAERLIIQEKELVLSCAIQCRPVDSSTDRIYVHFADEQKSVFSTPQPIQPQTSSTLPPTQQSTRWQWSSGSDSVQFRLLPTEEWSETSIPQNIVGGTIWEIRFVSPQTLPFEINGTTTIPLTEMFSIPLASVPAASSQKGTVTIEAPHPGEYRILNTSLHSLPLTAPEDTHYQTIRGTFRYDPAQQFPSPLTLQRFQLDDLPPTAWIWNLHLHSQYDTEGFVRNNAVFLLENQGKKHLQIVLPDGIAVDNVRMILLNGQRIAHRSGQKKTQKHEILTIPMPEKSRFVSLSIEYTYQDTPLIHQRYLVPKYPSADIPILSKDWAVWFPSDFEAIQQFNPVLFQRTNEHYKKHFLSNSPFSLRSLIPDAWEQFLYGETRRTEAKNAVSVFFNQMEHQLGKTENRKEYRGGVTQNSADKALTWSNLFNNEKDLSNALSELQKEDEKTAVAKIFIDKHSLAMLGIQPDLPIKIREGKNVTELFEQSGLKVLLASKTTGRNKEYSFYITSAFLCALRRQFHSLPLDNTACYFLEDFPTSINTGTHSEGSAFRKTQEWVSVTDWNRRVFSPSALWSLQWSLQPQMLPDISALSGWNVFEVPQDTQKSLYLIHRPTYTAYHFLAFLLTVVLTSTKRFSHTSLLLLILLSCIVTYFVSSHYAGISYGIFLGLIVSLGFGFIRSKQNSIPFATTLCTESSPHGNNTDFAHSSHSDHTLKALNTVSNTVSSRTFLILFLLGLLSCLWFASNVQGQEIVPETTVPLKNTLTASLDSDKPEPYRVFYPIDENWNVVGTEIFIPMTFLRFLSQSIYNAHQNTPQDWDIERAEYEGTFAYRSQTQLLELSDDFTATYNIRLNVGKTMLVLPPLPLRQNHVLWDTRPVLATQRENQDGKYDALLLPIENETAGNHTLVLPLLLKQESFNDISRVTLDIPKVPNAVLRLKTPQDASPIRVAHSLGVVVPNSLEGTTLSAQIGPAEKLAFSWNNELASNNIPLLEADQYFRLSARIPQVEIRAVFRLRIDNGTIRQLQIQTDPRWRRSGQFYCAEVPIDSAEPLLNTENNRVGEGIEQNEITRIVFQKPVSGTITLEAGFVLQDFNGIGKIRLPQFKTLNTRISRSILAVFADPLLQLDYPETGLLTEKTETIGVTTDSFTVADFPVSLPSFSPVKPTSIAASSSLAKNEIPAAEYDLSKTDASWVLAVRAKKQIPVLTQYQSVLLNDGNASLVCRNEFQTAGEVFQQHFTLPKNTVVESVEVLNAEKKPVEIRWGKIRKTQNTETATSHNEYSIFFIRPVSKQYSIVVRGYFPVPIKEEHPIPLLTFSDIYVKETFLTLFRTPSVMAMLKSNETPWSSSDSIPASSVEQSTEQSVERVPDSRWIPLRSYQWSAPASASNVSVTPPLALSVRLSPNSPQIRGDQMITLRRSIHNLWELSFDVLWDIAGGECYTVSFLWDARCSSILSVEPPMPYRIQQKNGQTVLTLTPTVPLSGRQHIKIRTALDTSGTSLSIPRLALQPEDTTTTDIHRFLILPKYSEESLIPWNYTLLAQTDAETQEYLKSTTNTTDADFLFLNTLGDNDSASIVQEKKLLISSFFDIHFFVQKDGTLYGTAIVDLKHREQDSFTLYLPDGYELIQFSSGSLSKGVKISKNRWKFDLWSSDYPHRLHIIFRGITSATTSTKKISPVVLKLPLLEGVSVHKTIWTISLVSSSEQPVLPFSIAAVREDLFGFPPTALSQELTGETVTELEHYVPVDGTHSASAQLKLNIIRLDNLLKVLDSVSSSSTIFKTEEGKRWLTLWAKEWNRLEKTVEEQLQKSSDSDVPILQDKGDENTQPLLSEYIWTILESNNVPPLFQALKQNYQNKMDQISAEKKNTEETLIQIPNASFYGWEENRNIFGVSEGSIKELRLQSLPNTFLWFSNSWGISLLCFILPLPLLLLSRKNLLTDLFFQFPYFWGTAIGLLFWCFCPFSLIGPAIILLILLSSFYPVWKKYKK